IDLRLDVADDDARPHIEPAGRLDARVEGRKPSRRFERIAGRREPPDAVERQPFQRKPGDERVPFVRRIERAAEKHDAHVPRDGGQARDRCHEAACWARSSAWRSAVSASMISSSPSPSMILSSEYRVRFTRWSVTRPCGKL